MSKQRTSQDQQVLREKLKQVAALVDDFERKVDTFRSEVVTTVILDTTMDVPALLHSVNTAMQPLARTGTARSLILEDFNDACARLGPEWAARRDCLAVAVSEQTARLAVVRENPLTDNATAYHETQKWAADIVNLLTEGLRPFVYVQQQIVRALNGIASAAQVTTDRKRANIERDQRFRELKKQRPDLSFSEIAELRDSDPVLTTLRGSTRITEHTVRDALRTKGGKKHPRKSRVK